MNHAKQPGGLRCHDPYACALGQKACPTPAACCCAPTEANASISESEKENAARHYGALALEAQLSAIGAGGVESLRKRETELVRFMDRGVLRMPLDMAMASELSRTQFYGRVQSLLDRIDAIAAQPSRECLHQSADMTDAEIDRIAESMPGGLDGFLKGWGWRQFARAALQAAPPAPAVPEIAANAPDLLPPMGIRNDRDMLNYLMGAFNSEVHYCERCGHDEDTKDMDSASFLREYLAAAQAQAVAVQTNAGITIDFKQATELLAMFGGEPAEVTLIEGSGHSGEGLYASYTDMPEEGSGFLGVHDNEAAPAQEHATQLAGQGLEDARDAARWREALRHVGGQRNTSCQTFGLVTLKPVSGNIMQGSVSEHFTKAIDAAMNAGGAT